jgi:hypothetical protein
MPTDWGRNVTKKLFTLFLTVLLAGIVAAQDVSIREDHPDEYIVVKGDTLWDISARFLQHPWQWPAIWHANQQIENPHLIYPGDRISLIYLDGMPQLSVDRGKATVKMAPGMRTTSEEAVGAISLNLIKPFLADLRILSAEEFNNLPYVVANYETRIVGSVPKRTYVRGLNGQVGQRFSIVRLSNVYYGNRGDVKRTREGWMGTQVPHAVRQPFLWSSMFRIDGDRKDLIGYELWEMARGELVKTGDPAILEITAGRTEVEQGDFIVPLSDYAFDAQFFPRALDRIPDNLRVLAIAGAGYGVGHNQIVSINGGANVGIETGHVFSTFRQGEIVRDDIKFPAGSWQAAGNWSEAQVELPAEYNGHIMVFRVFDRVSYALVMDGARAVQENDILRHPDEKY